MTKTPHETFILVGRIVKPVGLRGEVSVSVSSDTPDRFISGATIYIDEHAHVILKSRQTNKGIVLKLGKIDSLVEAESLRNKTLYVDELQVPPPPDGSYYYYQVMGIQVYTIKKTYLGKVTEIIRTGSNDVYAISGGPRNLLIPALDSVIIDVDIESKQMTVDLPDGL
jgi:16S rRNA processing protein RimM